MHFTNSLVVIALSSVANVMAASCIGTPRFELDTDNTEYLFKGKPNSCAGRGSFPNRASEITDNTITALGSSFVTSLARFDPSGKRRVHACAVQALKNEKYAVMDFNFDVDETFHITDLSSRGSAYIVEAFMNMWRAQEGPTNIYLTAQHTGRDSPDHNRGDKKYPLGAFTLMVERLDDPHRESECPYIFGH